MDMKIAIDKAFLSKYNPYNPLNLLVYMHKEENLYDTDTGRSVDAAVYI